MKPSPVHDRLLSLIRLRLQNGELTERGFARSVGMSQSHIHKVLKGSSLLSMESLEGLLRWMDFSVLDLYTEGELLQHLTQRKTAAQPHTELAVLDSPVGPGFRWSESVTSCNVLQVPCAELLSITKPIVARLSEPYGKSKYNVALLDCSPAAFSAPQPHLVYVVDRGEDTVVRRVRRAERGLYLVGDGAEGQPDQWEKGSGYVIRARVAWLALNEDRKG